jgi:hypothetical protein
VLKEGQIFVQPMRLAMYTDTQAKSPLLQIRQNSQETPVQHLLRSFLLRAGAFCRAKNRTGPRSRVGRAISFKAPREDGPDLLDNLFAGKAKKSVARLGNKKGSMTVNTNVITMNTNVIKTTWRRMKKFRVKQLALATLPTENGDPQHLLTLPQFMQSNDQDHRLTAFALSHRTE